MNKKPTQSAASQAQKIERHLPQGITAPDTSERFIELAGKRPGGGFQRNIFINAEVRPRNHPFVKELIRARGDVYRSIAEYPEAKRSTEHRCRVGLFDIDCEGNLGQARQQTVAVIRLLSRDLGIPSHDVWVAFSGHKGFHVLLSDALFGEVSCAAKIWTWRHVATSLQDEVAPSIDLSIYRQGSLIRCPNTLNTKSGKYDIPLETAELEGMSSDEILWLAKNPRSENPWTSPEASDQSRAWLRCISRESVSRLRQLPRVAILTPEL